MTSYYETHREKSLEYSKNYYEKNKMRISQYNHQYYQNHKAEKVEIDRKTISYYYAHLDSQREKQRIRYHEMKKKNVRKKKKQINIMKPVKPKKTVAITEKDIILEII